MLLFLFVVFFSSSAYAGGPEEGEFFGHKLGKTLVLEDFIVPESEHDRKHNMHSLNLTDEVRELGFKSLTASYTPNSFILESMSVGEEYESWEELRLKAKQIVENFSNKYGGEVLDISEKSPEYLFSDKKPPNRAKIYQKDFNAKYTLTVHVGQNTVPLTKGKVFNVLDVAFEFHKDSYERCYLASQILNEIFKTTDFDFSECEKIK